MKPKRIILVIDDGQLPNLPFVLKTWGYIALSATSETWQEVLARNGVDMVLIGPAVSPIEADIPWMFVGETQVVDYVKLREKLRLPLLRKTGPKGPRKAVGCQMAEERKAAS